MSMLAAGNVQNTVSPVVTPLTPISAPAAQSSGGVSFGDVLDAINPLQHIPVVSSLYRSATGSTISPGSQIIGDTMFGMALGGPLLAGAAASFGASVADVTVSQATGQSIAGHVLSTFGLGSATSASSTAASSTVTQLTPIDPASIPTTPGAPAQTPAQQASAAAALMLHGTHPERSNAQYMHAQALDAAINKPLLKLSL